MTNQSQVLEKDLIAKKVQVNISGAIIMLLKKGDKVWLEAEVETEKPKQAEVTIYFSGFLNSSLKLSLM